MSPRPGANQDRRGLMHTGGDVLLFGREPVLSAVPKFPAETHPVRPRPERTRRLAGRRFQNRTAYRRDDRESPSPDWKVGKDVPQAVLRSSVGHSKMFPAMPRK